MSNIPLTKIMLAALLILSSCSIGKPPNAQGSKATAKNTDTTHLDFEAEEAPEWTALFRRDSGWFGADGIFSIPLNGADTANASDSAMFIFSDTMVGEVVDGKIKKTYPSVNNSVAYITGVSPKKEDIKFYYGKNKAGLPAALFIPETAHAQSGDYYWLGDGFVNKALNNNTYIFAYRMRNMGKGMWDFTQVGNVLIILPAGSRPPFKNQRQIETPFLISGTDESDNGSLGAGIFVNTKEAGAPNPDGFVYVYGVQGKKKNLMVARIRPADFEKFDQWRFWDGKGWNKDMRKTKYVTNNVSNELSVTPLADGRYALVFQVGGMSSTVGLRLGLTPHGPFGPIIKVWDCKETQHKNYYTYNAKAHPCLSKQGELLISYNVNAFDYFREINANPHLYRPRFIRLKIK